MMLSELSSAIPDAVIEENRNNDIALFVLERYLIKLAVTSCLLMILDKRFCIDFNY